MDGEDDREEDEEVNLRTGGCLHHVVYAKEQGLVNISMDQQHQISMVLMSSLGTYILFKVWQD